MCGGNVVLQGRAAKQSNEGLRCCLTAAAAQLPHCCLHAAASLLMRVAVSDQPLWRPLLCNAGMRRLGSPREVHRRMGEKLQRGWGQGLLSAEEKGLDHGP